MEIFQQSTKVTDNVIKIFVSFIIGNSKRSTRAHAHTATSRGHTGYRANRSSPSESMIRAIIMYKNNWTADQGYTRGDPD